MSFMFLCLVINIDLFGDFIFYKFLVYVSYAIGGRPITGNLWHSYITGKTCMTIKTPQELHGFLIGNNLVRLCPEAQNFVACMDILSRMCACDPPNAKQTRWNQCMQCYIGFARQAQNHAATLFSKTNDTRISFYLNNQIIADIGR